MNTLKTLTSKLKNTTVKDIINMKNLNDKVINNLTIDHTTYDTNIKQILEDLESVKTDKHKVHNNSKDLEVVYNLDVGSYKDVIYLEQCIETGLLYILKVYNHSVDQSGNSTSNVCFKAIGDTFWYTQKRRMQLYNLTDNVNFETIKSMNTVFKF
jgi:hypothetical protein